MSVHIAIQKQLGDFKLDIDVTLGDGVSALFGRSGAGKSSIISAVAGLMKPDAGQITVGSHMLYDSARGVHRPAHKREIGLVFQDSRLFPHKSVLANLRYGVPRGGGVSGQDIASMAQLLGIEALLNRKPAYLSGGEAQRVAIGRALLSKPKLLMMDEPLAGLDQARKADILAVLERLRDASDIPILYVSHAREEVLRLASDVVVLERGTVIDQGAPAQILAGSAGGLARTLGARLVSKSSVDGLSELSLAGGRLFVAQVAAPLGSQLRVEIAARDVMLALEAPSGLSALNVLPVGIVGLAPSPTNPAAVDVMLDCGGDALVAQVTRRSVSQLDLQPGLQVYAVIKSVALAQPSGAMETLDV